MVALICYSIFNNSKLLIFEFILKDTYDGIRTLQCVCVTNFLKDRKVHFNVMHLREKLGISKIDI